MQIGGPGATVNENDAVLLAPPLSTAVSVSAHARGASMPKVLAPNVALAPVRHVTSACVLVTAGALPPAPSAQTRRHE